MKKEIVVITLIGPDKIGIVQTISQTVTFHHANWLNSSMANLAGQFAGILEIEVDPDQRDALLKSLNSIEDCSLQIQTTSPVAASASAQRQVTLELLGQDHPGIIHEITRVLSSLKLSIEELKTSTEDAPMSGGTLFRAFAVLNIPENMSSDKIQDLQHELSKSLMVDVTISNT
ncbi:MAG: glycine cleavage system regulatory protein [Granulosicoccus sp.]|jgi:glycine cleavage system regulatory protein